MKVYFYIVDYDELTLPLADDQEVYAVDTTTVSIDPLAGPYVGTLFCPNLVPGTPTERLVLVNVHAPLYWADDGTARLKP